MSKGLPCDERWALVGLYGYGYGYCYGAARHLADSAAVIASTLTELQSEAPIGPARLTRDP
jgi:hypothetical protein